MALRLAELNDEKFIEEVNFTLQSNLKYNNELLQEYMHLPSSTKTGKPLRPPIIEKLVGKRASFPLTSSHNSIAKPRCVLIGDAGNKIHPLAGQGLNMGLRDVNSLNTSILHGWYCGADVGVDNTVLNSIRNDQFENNIPIGAGVHLIEKLFKSERPEIIAARNLGMSVLNNLKPIKDLVGDFARK